MAEIIIRDAEERDYPFIVNVNEVNVEVLSPMDLEKTKYFHKTAEMFRVAEADGKIAGFLIAVREGTDYDSENYVWFSNKYPEFLYIDRVVIDEPFRGMGVGRAFYEDVAAHARATGVKVVTAEIDTEPVYNDTSLKFHAAMGFKEVGVQWVRGNSIKVSLEAWEV